MVTLSREKVLRSGLLLISSGEHPETVQLAQGYTGWLFSEEAQGGVELPTSGSAVRYITH